MFRTMVRLTYEFLHRPSWWYFGWALPRSRAIVDRIIREEFERETQ